jgi:hypothetical protein
MADIDATDNHMGRVDNPTLTEPHKFQGTCTTRGCERCGQLRIHVNHKGIDYDAPKPTEPERRASETIADEAMRIVYGDREQAYDDPNVNFEKIALMWQGLWLRKLKPDARITPEEVALASVLLKVSRESHKPQRDNRVDIIGYILCGDRIVQKREREAAEELEMMDGYNAAE